MFQPTAIRFLCDSVFIYYILQAGEAGTFWIEWRNEMQIVDIQAIPLVLPYVLYIQPGKALLLSSFNYSAIYKDHEEGLCNML